MPARWVVTDEPPQWLRTCIEKEEWPPWAVQQWRERLGKNGVGQVGITHYPDHATIDFDSSTWEDIDPNDPKPLDDALNRAVTRLEREKRELDRG